MAREKITVHDYNQLVGLLVVAQYQEEKVENCVDAANAILDEDDYSHFNDAVWGYKNMTVDDILRKMDIEVENE